jgi:hypothetical protein
MEGTPGHQAAGISTAAGGVGGGRGAYDNNPTADSFPGYPLESYRTFGGFDWMTATVGGLWDSLLAEGKGWWITANSDAHKVHQDTFVRGAGDGQYDDPASPFFGGYGDPVDTGVPSPASDFWPGFYSRTVVGARRFSFESVLAGLRQGRVFVVHGDLLRTLDLWLRAPGPQGTGTLGQTIQARKGDSVELSVRVGLTSRPNFGGDIPRLRRVDVISGPITGPAGDPDTLTAPATRVVRSFDVDRKRGTLELRHVFRDVDGPFYVRLRGTDGNLHAPGSIEPGLDPLGDSDPWTDLWFYTNPIFVTTQ